MILLVYGLKRERHDDGVLPQKGFVGTTSDLDCIFDTDDRYHDFLLYDRVLEPSEELICDLELIGKYTVYMGRLRE